MLQFLSNANTLLLATEEGGHAAEALSDGGLLASLAWLIPLVPMVAAFAIALYGKRMPYKGWDMAIAVMGFEALYGTALLLAHIANPIAHDFKVEIARIGSMPIEWGWTVDGLSIMMYFLVGVVGFFVFLYAKGYMEGDIRFTWFFASFTLFAGGMLVLVAAPNMIQLIVGWELVGVSSWLLIGHYWEEHANSSAAIKAFLTNKIADVGLFVGAIIVSMSVGSFRFSDILHAVETGAAAAPELSRYAFWAGLALFIGAMGKSGQFPLHVWLPDAMAGPTPVSSLMHAATMVTAGIFLVGRMFPFYAVDGFADDVRGIIIVIGALTLFLTGLIALVQDDIRLHDGGDGGGGLHRRSIPLVHPRLLQGVALLGRRLGDSRGPFEQHVRHGWAPQIHAADFLDVRHRLGGPGRHLPVGRLLVERRDPRFVRLRGR
jgi:NADH-quinone oxidoreductase subunit L